MNKTIVSGYLVNNLNVNYNGKVGFMTIAVKRPYPYNLNQNGEKVTDLNNITKLENESIIQIGKGNFYKIIVK